jgi:hypothetical protein
VGLPSHIDTVALGKPIAPYGCLNPYRCPSSAGFPQTKLFKFPLIYPAPPGKSLFLSSCLMMLTTVRLATVLWSASSAFGHFFRNRVAAPFTTAGLQPLNLTVYSCPSSRAGTAKQLNSSCLNFRLDAFVL